MSKVKKKGQRCCVPGCQSDTIANRNVSFHTFPKDSSEKQIWINRINRVGNRGKYSLWQPTQYHRICGLHFNKSGKRRYEDKYPIYFKHKTYERLQLVPSSYEAIQNVQYEEIVPHCEFEGNMQQEPTLPIQQASPHGPTLQIQQTPRYTYKQMPFKTMLPSITDSVTASNDHNYGLPYMCGEEVSALIKTMNEEILLLKEQLAKCTCMERNRELSNIQNELETQRKKNINVRLKLQILEHQMKSCRQAISFNLSNILNNEQMLKFYTGFKSVNRFKILLKFMYLPYRKAKRNIPGRPSSLSYKEQALVFCCRLRLGLLEQDLAYRFCISQSAISKIVIFWINLCSVTLNQINIWPSKDLVCKYMPISFKNKYPTTRVVIDSTELFIEMPSDFIVQSYTYSQYKSHNTAKGLLGITPNGFVSFISDLYPGRSSDKEIFNSCGILQLLEPGDSVMADKGYVIRDELEARGVALNIPPFLASDSKQFSPADVEKTKEIASLRIHVERVISEIKTFRILKFVFPNSAHCSLNQIWKICCHLQNFINEPLLNRKVCNINRNK
ncbi:uncharacterized protein LOC116182512 isoform X1 [Photinus pyralis]|uniref:uncharacterized protein LOC116182512 isoform X1 n=1 Tax=Photinus pyralis TaxID=7054 RepID=UPI0012674498|nr:uncharacterized protein LOC116182512 isoform X1 [Photinus pyralis]